MTATHLARHDSNSSNGSASSLVNIQSMNIGSGSTPDTEDYVHLHSDPLTSASASNERKAKLLYCKSHVAIHPTAFHRDNISGYLGLVEVDSEVRLIPDTNETDGKDLKGKDVLVFWVPNEVLERLTDEEREGYKKVEERSTGALPPKEVEDGFVFVTVPPPKGEKYAFSVPVSGIYSILVYPPSLTHWHGSATFNLMGGVSLPTLFFHDDESPLLTTPTTSNRPPNPRAQWGFPPFLTLLDSYSTLLRSRLLTGNRGAELWLVNPSKSDREVHENDLESEIDPVGHDRKESTTESPYPPIKTLPSMAVLNQSTPRQTLLTSLSNLTNLSRKTAQTILSHPLAQPVVPHLPPAVRSLVTVPGEWERANRLSPKTRSSGREVATEFEAARLYLARWARVVAEEGERARKSEVASRAGLRRASGDASSPTEDASSSLGVFSLLASPNSRRPAPTPTRTPNHPITAKDWESFSAQGRSESYVRQEIFKRGFSDSTDSLERAARTEGREVLLGVVPWSVGGVGGGVGGKDRRKREREALREKKRGEYGVLKEKWRSVAKNQSRFQHGETEGQQGGEEWKEEWHRIDVDCRRTDRNQPIFAVPPEIKGEEEKEAGGVGSGVDWEGKMEKEEEGGMAGLNPHIAALRTVLMTYHTYSPELGYVQGMSDLLSPIYVVFQANEADSFWGLVGVMKMMESNFLRDQSGMKRQLSTLQQLIGVMDPELYSHLERTDSLNLFFCFRWILIAFKREFKFEKVIKLWEVLWTNFYSNQFVLFVALAVLQSHRDVLLRYLTEFDEVLKYANDLSGTIDLDTTLAQAEVLFLQFRGLVQDLDAEQASKVKEGSEGLRRRKGHSDGVEERKTGEEEVKKVSDDLRELLVCWQAE